MSDARATPLNQVIARARQVRQGRRRGHRGYSRYLAIQLAERERDTRQAQPAQARYRTRIAAIRAPNCHADAFQLVTPTSFTLSKRQRNKMRRTIGGVSPIPPSIVASSGVPEPSSWA